MSTGGQQGPCSLPSQSSLSSGRPANEHTREFQVAIRAAAGSSQVVVGCDKEHWARAEGLETA